MKNMEVDRICEVTGTSKHKITKIKSMDEDKSKFLSNNISNLANENSSETAIAKSTEHSSCIEISDFVNDSSLVEVYNSSVEIFNLSAYETAVSEEISKLVSDTCDAVDVIVNDNSATNEIHKSSVSEMAVSEDVSKFVSDTCDAVNVIVNDNVVNGHNVESNETTLNISISKSEKMLQISETINDDLYDAEMGDDDYDAVSGDSSNKNEFPSNEDYDAAIVDSSNKNELPSNDEMKKISELAECDSSDKISEMNEEDEECTNLFVETDVKDPVRKERHWTERASLPYYREPKPDFFEYTRKLQEELDPKPSVISKTHRIVLEEPVDHNNPEFHLNKTSSIPGTGRNKTLTAMDISLKKSNRIHSEKPASGLIILDDYKSPRVKNSHFSRSSDIWNISTLQSTKEKPEPVPGSKYKALKEQLMEKIMLKKEESFNKRKEEQDYDEEKFYEEEEVVSDATPCESENDLSDGDFNDDSPENAEDDVILKDMLLKECENFPDNISEETKYNNDINNSETEKFNPVIEEDSQEPMECYSLPSYQPGGGFSSSPLEKRNTKRIFSDSDFNDSILNSPSQQRSKGRIFSDSDFIDSGPSESSRASQMKNISNLAFKDSTDDQSLFASSSEQEIIPHWESLPVSEKQGSQLFDEDISVICSGKFQSTNDDIPWTPSSSLKNSLPIKEMTASPAFSNHIINEEDQLSESDEEELVRPAKKIKLSLVEKLWDSEDEDDGSSKDPILKKDKLEKNPIVQSNFDDNADHNLDDDSEEEDDFDEESEISQKHVNDSFEESDIKEANVEESAKKFEIKNFFENEAELSGEEASSDENEDDADEYIDDELITDDIVDSDEKLRKEVGTIHFKRQQDEDDQLIRQLKNDFLPEGELYNENGQRKRRYIWNNIGMDDNEMTETKSDSEEEEVESLPTDYLKWQQEKNKSNVPEDDEVEIVQTPKSISLKVDIVGKVSVSRNSSLSNSLISASPMVRRGSFLNSSLGKNMKFMKEFSTSEGSVSRKNFVFSSPQPNASLPATPSSEIKHTRINKSINNRSIFNKI